MKTGSLPPLQAAPTSHPGSGDTPKGHQTPEAEIPDHFHPLSPLADMCLVSLTAREEFYYRFRTDPLVHNLVLLIKHLHGGDCTKNRTAQVELRTPTAGVPKLN